MLAGFAEALMSAQALESITPLKAFGEMSQATATGDFIQLKWRIYLGNR